MGCLQSRSNDCISKSIVRQSGQNTFYTQLGRHGIITIFSRQFSTIEIQGRVFLLYWIESQFNIVDPQTCQRYYFLLRGEIQCVTSNQKYILIRTDRCLFIMQPIEDRIKIARQIRFRLGKWQQESNIIFISTNFIVVRQKYNLYLFKFSATGKLKQIFKLYIQIDFDNFMYYNSQYGALFFGDYNNLYILDIKSRLCRKVKLRCPSQAWYRRLKYVKIVENNIDVLFYVQKIGLFLNKINYQDGKIQSFRFIYSHVLSCDICEDNNQLTFYTANMYMTLDKDYNIKQKYGLNHNYENQKQDINIRMCRSYLFLLFKTPNQEMQFEIRIYKQNQYFERGTIQIREIKNYEVENVVIAEISQNQLYLAILKDQLLLLYMIEAKRESQYFFSQGLIFLSISSDSRQLCVTSYKCIIYFKCQQGLTKKYQLFYRLHEKVIFGRNGINISRDSKNRIIVISQSAKKIIFISNKLNEYDLMIQEYCPFTGIIMISQNFRRQLQLIYKLHDRKQINLNIKESNCILEQKTKELMTFKDTRFKIHCRKGSPNPFILQDSKIYVLDKNLFVIEEIQYDHLDFTPIQVMDNYILCKNHKGIQLIKRT